MMMYMDEESKIKLNHLEESIDKLATLVVGGFEKVDAKFERLETKMDGEFIKVHQEMDQLRSDLHSTRLNTASQVELNVLKDRVVHLEDFIGRKPAVA
jgi:hypothetical protein